MSKSKLSKNEAPAKIDILATAIELASFYKDDPSAVDRNDNSKGNELVGIFSDDRFSGKKFKDSNKMKAEAIKMAIDDLSRGGMTLKNSTIGITYINSKFQIYITPFGSPPEGNVVFSINLKNAKAFMKWRKGESFEIEQDDLNAAIYRLTVVLADYI